MTEQTALVRGCTHCMTEHPDKKGICPTCHLDLIDTYSTYYWFLMLKEKRPEEAAVTEKAKNPAEEARKAFKDDIIRLCRIHKMTINCIAYEVPPTNAIESYIVISALQRETELDDIRNAY